ncbi:UDP-glucose/GDP-mannose dehydrogenase family protein [Natronolimnobius sp. AArcel1]|uniref:UDP-glucose 6-dehydrogenase AglM n=1 Tax=Natronolimnobius sp. AArcel1 TaxID=1679093 RepID=UPI0013EA45F0|nr:UDP-glucose 6-dehydrogenase AglM [Natronolimnobius sp. AArcel1]NGM71390.1 UDP-glucose/GDP-mannose dehydrogenase family protein [Natronolimnobius sp. AArcel1]
MHITVIGSGYVGTTIAACFADLGHEVTAIDIDEEIVNTLNDGRAPITEPGLDDLLETHAGDRLTATTSYDAVPDSDVTFLAIGTPSNNDGSIDLSALEAAAEATGDALANKTDRHLVVIKSTVTPPSIPATLEPAIHSGANENDAIEVGMNPEFLREGSAVTDFQQPDKLVFGTQSEWATERLHNVFEPLLEHHDAPVVETDPETASMIKYANNAFLASKISLVNDLGNICKEFDLDAYEVMDAIGLDDRISERFLRSGVGWGGSCFPKDVNAIIAAAQAVDYDPAVLEGTVEVNDRQPNRMLECLMSHVNPEDARIAVLGLAFKPNTDDIRNSRAIPVIDALQSRGANVAAYDPVAADEMSHKFPDIEYAESAADALEGADGALVVTDWDEFSELDEEFDAMATPVVVDGRRCIERRNGIIYEGLTW